MEEGNLELLRETAREFARGTIGPLVMRYDEAHEFHHELIPPLAELGFLGAMTPGSYGGAGLTPLEFTVLVEEISAVDPSVGLTLCAHNGLCLGHINRFASEEQKRRFLPDLCSGKKLGGWGLTEPGSGSDSAGMRTTATSDGSSWVLNGSKAFITHASVGSTFVVLAVTGRSSGRSRISAFIVESTMPGFSRGKSENKLGMRSSDTATLNFENVRVPAENLIGAEGEGFAQAMEVLDGGRIGIAALAVGLAQGAFEASTRYARERQQFGKPLAAHQAIQWKLADMATGIAAARLLTRHAADLRTREEPVTLAASQAKLFSSEMASRTADEAVQIHGGYGFIKDFPVEKFYRDVKLLTIGEGTSEVQRMIIAKHILR
ncbi:MAG: acyl-CoA dehydrogenase family protein [Ignavibacteriae bacterium]|nr:acyl-CoA dehydrogenase family protein [Ignavibacteriota bacterium]